jgi:hypothetical protein
MVFNTRTIKFLELSFNMRHTDCPYTIAYQEMESVLEQRKQQDVTNHKDCRQQVSIPQEQDLPLP